MKLHGSGFYLPASVVRQLMGGNKPLPLYRLTANGVTAEIKFAGAVSGACARAITRCWFSGLLDNHLAGKGASGDHHQLNTTRTAMHVVCTPSHIEHLLR